LTTENAVLQTFDLATLQGNAMAKVKRTPRVRPNVETTSHRIDDRGSRSETVARVVAFSDGVIAIIVTIMVLSAVTNAHGAYLQHSL